MRNMYLRHVFDEYAQGSNIADSDVNRCHQLPVNKVCHEFNAFLLC